MSAQRYVVVGNTCAGKSTFALALATQLSVAYVELDALYWLPGWVGRPTEEFRSRVVDATNGNGWVVAGNYTKQWDISWTRAQVVIWLDTPLRDILWRIITRSYRRATSQELLWGTNREKFWPHLKLWDQQQSLIAWAVRHHAAKRRGYLAAMSDERWRHLTFLRFRSTREAGRWLREETKASLVGPRCE